jgi:hypothetical protein
MYSKILSYIRLYADKSGASGGLANHSFKRSHQRIATADPFQHATIMSYTRTLANGRIEKIQFAGSYKELTAGRHEI